MKKIKNYKIEIICFIIPIIIMLITCIINKMYPIGNNLLPAYDGYIQYPGFTLYLKKVLLGQESLFYSFKGMLGFNFYATSIYYLFNPTNILCLLANEKNIMQYYTFIIFLKIGLSSITMSKYIKYKYKDSNAITKIMFSCAYALMGYNICYYFNYMYFDVIVLFPLLITGLEKLIYQDNSKMYILILTLSIISNFYIGYMVCIFSLLYFIYIYINLKDKKTKIIKKFIISSLLSGLICSFILLPVIYELLQGKASLYMNEINTNYFDYNHNFINIFYKSMPGSFKTYDIQYGYVNIYVSLLTSILVILYFFNNKFSKKEKITTLVFIMFFLLSISFNLIDYMWHMFQKPIFYPNRYIFTFSFFLITIAIKSYINIENIKIKNLTKIIVAIIFILLSLISALSKDNTDFLNNKLKIVSFVLSSLLLIEYLFLLKEKKYKIIIISLFFLEITYNSILTITNLKFDHNLIYFNNDMQLNNNIIKKINNKTDFYRIEQKNKTIYNTGSFYNYNSISGFSSIRNKRITDFLGKNMDIAVNDDANILYNINNPYLNSILGLKYYIGDNLYVNENYLSLGFMVNKNIYSVKLNNNKFDNTNNIVNSMLNDKIKYTILNNYEFDNTKIVNENNKEYVISKNTKSKIEISGIAPYDGFLMKERLTKNYTYQKLFINDIELTNIELISEPIKIKKNDKYKIIIYSNVTKYEKKYLNWYLYSQESYNSFIKELNKNKLIITNYKKDNNIEGTIISDNKNVLFTSIPYEKGWKVYVDNKKQNYNKCLDTFICLDLEKGHHKIKFTYTPPYLLLGSIISIISLITTIFYIKKNNS